MAKISDSNLSLEITATDNTGQAINSAKQRLGDFGSSTGSALDKMKAPCPLFSGGRETL
ncbi:MAG: hypothetical protein FD156_193 [Nitrospirae bacterium]|nr:MAG: hypothetical protein FD156_193 [Nitrospirota bacterium]